MPPSRHATEFAGIRRKRGIDAAPRRGRTLAPVEILGNPAALLAILPRHARLLGLDVGTKTIGLALSDGTLTIASPYALIKRRKFTQDATDIAAAVKKEGVGGIVIGYPVEMDGKEGPRCQSIRQFARNLEPFLDVPAIYWDERLSTVAVTRTLLEADASRARRAELVDKLAAAYILQGLLDHLKHLPPAG